MLLHRVIAKQQAKRNSGLVHAVGRYENVENFNTQNDYETTSKKSTDKKET